MEPINYGAQENIPQAQDPTTAFLQGLQAPTQMANTQAQTGVMQAQVPLIQAQTQEAQVGALSKEYMLQRQQQMRQMIGQMGNAPSVEQIAQLSSAFPELTDQFKKSYDMLNDVQQRAKLKTFSPVYSAILNNRPDIASQMLNDHADAMENSGGDPNEIQQQRAFATMIKEHPDMARVTGGVLLSSAMGPDKFAQTFKDIGEENRANQKLPVELQKEQTETQNLLSQISNRAGQLNLDQNKLQTETQLKLLELKQKAPGGIQMPTDMRKDLNDAVGNSVTSDNLAQRYVNLANTLDKQGAQLGTGVFGKTEEWWKHAFGDENDLTALRQEYTRLRNSQAVTAFHEAGANKITDADIKFAMQGAPSDTANPAQMAQFLRGMAKLQNINSVVESSKADWINSVGSLGKSLSDITVNGVKVPSGTTFMQFRKEFFPRFVQQAITQNNINSTKNASYWKYAQPQGQQP